MNCIHFSEYHFRLRSHMRKKYTNSRWYLQKCALFLLISQHGHCGDYIYVLHITTGKVYR